MNSCRAWPLTRGTSGTRTATRRWPLLKKMRPRLVPAPTILTMLRGMTLTTTATGMTFPDMARAGRPPAWAITGIPSVTAHGATTAESGTPGSPVIPGDGGRITAAHGTGSVTTGGCGSPATTAASAVLASAGIRTRGSGAARPTTGRPPGQRFPRCMAYRLTALCRVRYRWSRSTVDSLTSNFVHWVA